MTGAPGGKGFRVSSQLKAPVVSGVGADGSGWGAGAVETLTLTAVARLGGGDVEGRGCADEEGRDQLILLF
jgi:hypothetical protein